MPGSVAAAAPATVFPNSLCSAFTHAPDWPFRQAGPYPDGRSQISPQATVGRNAWSLTKRLTITQYRTLQTFFNARLGSVEPFYFYPKNVNYDASGASTAGRYTVRFDGGLSRTFGIARQDVPVRLIEVA